jgi:hypothetical protein
MSARTTVAPALAATFLILLVSLIVASPTFMAIDITTLNDSGPETQPRV